MNAGGRFRFPLETVLKVKTLREEQARLELSRAHGQLARSRQALADTEAHISGTLNRFKEATARSLQASEYQWCSGIWSISNWLGRAGRSE